GIDTTTANLTNSTVSGNSAINSGGGIFAIDTANLTNSTVSGNTADGDGGGIRATTTTLTNSTVRGNSAGKVGGGILAHDVTLLNTPKNNGGPTQTMALLAGSPTIDAGDNTAVDPISGQPLTTDQRGTGFARKKDGNADGTKVIDIGAFEF